MMPNWFSKHRALPAGIQKYDGTAMESYLKNHPTVLYQYQANTYGLIILSVLAVVAAGLATYIWMTAGWVSIWHGLALGLLLLTAVGSASLVVYWYYFTKIHYLATSDRDLIIGKGKEIVAIDWDVLDTQAVKFGGVEPSNVNGAVVMLHVGEKRYRMRLFTRYACLKNLHGFISTLLEHIRPGDEETSPASPGNR